MYYGASKWFGFESVEDALNDAERAEEEEDESGGDEVIVAKVFAHAYGKDVPLSRIEKHWTPTRSLVDELWSPISAVGDRLIETGKLYEDEANEMLYSLLASTTTTPTL